MGTNQDLFATEMAKAYEAGIEAGEGTAEEVGSMECILVA